MKIKFVSIDIDNFMSIGQAHIDLDNKGYILVSGRNNNPQDLAKSNGSGKSSIFDAIMWGLSGNTIRGNKDIVNINGDDGTLVELNFIVDNTHYKIIRSKNHSIYKTNLKIYINNEDKSGKGIRDSEKLLSEYLPDLTPSLIGSVIILGQGLPERFTNNTPSGRKEVLEKLCKSDFMIQELKDRIFKRKQELQEQLRTTEDAILVLNTKVSIAESNIKKCQESLLELQSHNNFDEELLKVTQSLDYHRQLVEGYQTDYALQCDIDRQLTAKLAQLSADRYKDIEAIHNEYEPEIDSKKSHITQVNIELTTAKNKLKELQSIKDTCPTCGQKLPDVVKPDTTDVENTVTTCEQQLHNLQSELDTIDTEFKNVLKVRNDSYDDEIRDINEQLNSCRALTKSVNDNINSINNTIKGLESTAITLQSKKDNYIVNIEKLNKEIEDQDNILIWSKQELLYKYDDRDTFNKRLSIISQFNTIVTRDFRGYLLSSIITFIDKTAKEYSKDIFGTDLIDFSLDGNNITISYNSKEYEALSGGEKQKVDLIIQFSIRDMLCVYTNFSTNIIVLDEIFDNLDEIGCNKVINLISNKLSDISSIFIITHHGSELNIPCDEEIVVVKNEQGVSYIS